MEPEPFTLPPAPAPPLWYPQPAPAQPPQSSFQLSMARCISEQQKLSSEKRQAAQDTLHAMKMYTERQQGQIVEMLRMMHGQNAPALRLSHHLLRVHQGNPMAMFGHAGMPGGSGEGAQGEGKDASYEPYGPPVHAERSVGARSAFSDVAALSQMASYEGAYEARMAARGGSEAYSGSGGYDRMGDVYDARYGAQYGAGYSDGTGVSVDGGAYSDLAAMYSPGPGGDGMDVDVDLGIDVAARMVEGGLDGLSLMNPFL